MPVAGSSIRCEDSAPVSCTPAGYVADAERVLMARGGGTIEWQVVIRNPIHSWADAVQRRMACCACCTGGAQASRSGAAMCSMLGTPVVDDLGERSPAALDVVVVAPKIATVHDHLLPPPDHAANAHRSDTHGRLRSSR